MSTRHAAFFIGIAACVAATMAPAQSFDPSSLTLLEAMNRQPNVLARYAFLIKITPTLSVKDQALAGQFRSFSESELGLYNQAVLSFPLKSRIPFDISLPKPAEWTAENAIDTITRLAADRHIVLINEAHHDAHTRQLTLALLPRLRKLGFTYFAAEALTDTDAALMQRGYPLKTSGVEYLDEPLYGEIIREAIRLGFIIVPYDSANHRPQARENEQARNLRRRVFAKDPNARIFIHGGYAHIDKKSGRLFKVNPMGLQLKKSIGFDPLCIDQTDFLESGMEKSDAYHVLIKRFPSDKAVVLINRQTGAPWSARPDFYDLNVILPPSLRIQAFGVNRLYEDQLDDFRQIVKQQIRISPRTAKTNQMLRPDWLQLDGSRHPIDIATGLCGTRVPCAVAAHYFNESDDAIAADRYAFMNPQSSTKLYLRPGKYRLRAWGIDGKTLSERTIDVSAR